MTVLASSLVASESTTMDVRLQALRATAGSGHELSTAGVERF